MAQPGWEREGAAGRGWFVPLEGCARHRRRGLPGAAGRGWAPGCRERLSAIPALAWLPLTLLLSYKYAFPAGSSILAPTHSQTRAESGCSEKKPSLASQELFFPVSLPAAPQSSPGEAPKGCPALSPLHPSNVGCARRGTGAWGKAFGPFQGWRLAQLGCSRNS